MKPDSDRVRLPNGFTLWPWFQVRGAGFPAEGLCALGAPGALLAATDRLAAPDASRPAGGAPPSTGAADFAAAFEAERERVQRELHRWARDPRFREAVTWQNPAAAAHALGGLAKKPPGSLDKASRKRGLLVARYLQRYLAKNDTIGFFGPIGWGRITAAHEVSGAPSEPAAASGLQQAPGARLAVERRVHFEAWAVAALASAYADVPAIRERLEVELSPFLRVDGDRLLGSTQSRRRDGSRPLPADLRAAWEAMRRGARTIGSLVAALAADGSRSATEADAQLRAMLACGWLRARIAVAIEADPERRLERALEAFGSPDPAASALDSLRSVVEAQRAVARASGDAAALTASLAALGERFTDVTGRAATRRAGETYAARTLVYEDSRRGTAVTAAPRLLDRIREPLGLVLAAARWFTHDVARRVLDRLAGAFERRQVGGRVHLPVLWRTLLPLLGETRGTPIADASEELGSRWLAATGITAARLTAGEPIRVALADAVPARIAEAFAAPGPGWPSARHHGVDLLLASAGPEAAARGEGQLLLGELHPGMNPFESLSALTTHPEPRALEALLRADLAPRIGALPDTPYGRCAHDGHFAPTDRHLDLGGRWSSWREGDPLRVGDLFVERGADDRLVCVGEGLSAPVDLLAVIERPVKLAAAQAFSLVPSPSPEVHLGELMLVRPSWRAVTRAEPWCREKTPSARWTGFRGLAQRLGLPRFVFLRSPNETKPVCLDTESTASAEIAARLLRACEAVTLSSMRPDLDELWLRDARGARYTAELRFIACDPRPFVGPGMETAE